MNKLLKTNVAFLIALISSTSFGKSGVVNTKNNNENTTEYRTDFGCSSGTGRYFHPEEVDNTIYRTASFAPYYFKNLKNNFGYNEKGSCGFIATGMILSYLDTYYDDNIIEEKYEQTATLSYNQMNFNVESPGIKREPEYLYNGVSNNQYMANVQNPDYYNTYFHFRLIKMGIDLGLTANAPNSYGIGSNKNGSNVNDEKILLEEYLYSYRNYSSSTVSVENIVLDDPYFQNPNHSEKIRKWVIERVKKGIPVIVKISGIDHLGGHYVVAYDYNETADELFCNFGYSEEETHVRLLDERYYYYDWATAVNYSGDGTRSNNYVYKSGSTSYYHSPLELITPKNISISNLYLDQTPKFTWSWNNPFYQDERFGQNSTFLFFSIVDVRNNYRTIYSTITNWTSLTADDYCLKAFNPQNYSILEVRVGVATYSNPNLYNLYYAQKMFNAPTTFKSSSNQYLGLTSPSKNGSWTITVTNNSLMTLTVYYNSKLCFLNDGLNWSGLKDVKQITLSPFQSKKITVSTNVFAKTIAVSYTRGSTRYITCYDTSDRTTKTSIK